MLHVSFQCHMSIGSGEDFESILTIVGLKAVLVM